MDTVKGWLKMALRGGTRALTVIGVVLAALGALCSFNPHEVAIAWPEWGPRACAIIVLLGAFSAAFGKGLADRRTDPGPTPSEPLSVRGLHGGGVGERRGTGRRQP